MVRIIVVHGRGTKPSKACKLRYVREVLTESVRRVDRRAARRLARRPEAIQLVYFADLLRGAGERPEACASFREPLDRLYRDSRSYQTWLAFRGALQDVGMDVTVALARWLRPSARRRLMEERFGDVMRYFRDRALAAAIRQRVQATLVPALRRGERVILLAHSLGSVVAYDVLWTLSHASFFAAVRGRSIEHFVTLGSPLGDRLIKSMLLGWRRPGAQRYPTNIRRWTNISARGDLICHDASLRNDFEGMLRQKLVRRFTERLGRLTVYRSREGLWNPHKLYGYLILPDVGRLVANAIPRGGEGV